MHHVKESEKKNVEKCNTLSILSGVIRKENITNRYLLTDGYNADACIHR